jgi:hypothetical protein
MSKRIVMGMVLLLLIWLMLAACASAPAASPAGPDTDGDGIPDSAEIVLGTDPNNPDSDGDGQNDLADSTPLKTDNPIQESSTKVGFVINAIAVENNVDASGTGVPDHLELSLSNNTTQAITGFDMYYTLTDTVTNDVQSFYQTLPGFTLKAGEAAQIHFDTGEMPGHFRADPYSLFYTGANALVVDVTLHAAGYAPQISTINKGAPGAEAGGD